MGIWLRALRPVSIVLVQIQRKTCPTNLAFSIRLSAPYQKFLEGLTATFSQPEFKNVADRGGFKLYEKPRGAPENVGNDLTAIHPVIRTNPGKRYSEAFELQVPDADKLLSNWLEVNFSRRRSC